MSKVDAKKQEYNSRNKWISKKFQELLKNMSESVRKVGIDKVNNKLKQISIHSNISEKSIITLVNYTVNCVLHEYKYLDFTKEQLFESKQRGEITEAKELCIVSLRNNIPKLSKKEIGVLLGISHKQYIYRILKKYDEMDINKKIDAPFLIKVASVQKKIDAYKKNEK